MRGLRVQTLDVDDSKESVAEFLSETNSSSSSDVCDCFHACAVISRHIVPDYLHACTSGGHSNGWLSREYSIQTWRNCMADGRIVQISFLSTLLFADSLRHAFICATNDFRKLAKVGICRRSSCGNSEGRLERNKGKDCRENRHTGNSLEGAGRRSNLRGWGRGTVAVLRDELMMLVAAAAAAHLPADCTIRFTLRNT